MIIAGDFDGTLWEDRYPEIGYPMPQAIASMRRLHEDGHYLILWTCRTGERLKDAINWLLERGVPIDRVNDHCPENLAKYGEGGLKVYADRYIDDKAGFTSWFEEMEKLGYKD